MAEIPYRGSDKRAAKCQIGVVMAVSDRAKLDARLTEDNLTITDFIRSCSSAYINRELNIV